MPAKKHKGAAAEFKNLATKIREEAMVNARVWLDEGMDRSPWNNLLCRIRAQAKRGAFDMYVNYDDLGRDDGARTPNFWREALIERLKFEGFKVTEEDSATWVVGWG